MQKVNLKKLIPLFIRNPLRRLRNFILNLLQNVNRYYLYLKDYRAFKKISKNNNRFSILWNNRFPQILDKTKETLFDPHYIYHPAWAARIITKINIKKHIDISSTLHFSTILSAFIPVEFYDYRPANIRLDNFISKEGDLLSLPFPDDSVESLSCMHTIEHIGLGRYGDKIDPDGDLKALKEISRVIAPSGNFIFVTPIGKPKIYFNAHRINT